MARRKIVLLIVEGPSDETALGILFTRILGRERVLVKTMRGDITTQVCSSPAAMTKRVDEIVKRYAKQNHFLASDFAEVVQITDTDGAFIPEENVIQDGSAEGHRYTDKYIYAEHAQSIIMRNKHKSANLKALVACCSVWQGIPYSIYYMSANLDHVLYNSPHNPDSRKENDAYKFAKEYKEKTNEFIKYISDSDFSVKKGYNESWNFIEEGVHSIERHTNLGIYLRAAARLQSTFIRYSSV